MRRLKNRRSSSGDAAAGNGLPDRGALLLIMSITVSAVWPASAQQNEPSSITMDRSCHNMSRPGRTSVDVGPKVHVGLVIPVEDWPRLTRLFEEFGAANNLSFRNSNFDRPGTIRMLRLSLCDDRGLNIYALGERWERAGISVPEKSGVFLGIYELRDGSNWQQVARALIAELETHWPGKVQKLDGFRRMIIRVPDLREVQ
jgi:hypothetical protein